METKKQANTYSLPTVEMIKTVKRGYPPFYISLFYEGFNNVISWKKLLHFKYSISDYMAIDGLYYYPKYHMVDFVKRWLDLLFKDRNYFKEINKETVKREKKLLKSLNSPFSVFCKVYTEYVPTLGIYFICDDAIENKVRDLLLAGSNQKTVDELMTLISTPEKDHFYKKADLELIQTGNINLFIRKYGWLKSRYGNVDSYSKTEAVDILEKLNKDNFIDKYKKEKKLTVDAVKRAKKLLKARDRYIIDLMRFFIYYRTQRTDILNYASYKYASKLEKMAEKLGISYSDLLYCTHKEINSNLPSMEIIHERKKVYSFVASNNNYQIVSGEENEKLMASFANLSNKINSFGGRVAFPGIVTGRVKVVRSKNHLTLLTEGDILVTSMTTPEMISAMKKVAAFVTDEGGITCHAAIIAREMKKPCIIGTKIATQVLKDGDFVEVDAEKGIVKIINNK